MKGLGAPIIGRVGGATPPIREERVPLAVYYNIMIIIILIMIIIIILCYVNIVYYIVLCYIMLCYIMLCDVYVM